MIYLSPVWLPAYQRARALGYTPLDLLMAGVLAALASEPQEVRVRAGGTRVRRLPRAVVEAWSDGRPGQDVLEILASARGRLDGRR
jgi:hypothetical protein